MRVIEVGHVAEPSFPVAPGADMPGNERQLGLPFGNLANVGRL